MFVDSQGAFGEEKTIVHIYVHAGLAWVNGRRAAISTIGGREVKKKASRIPTAREEEKEQQLNDRLMHIQAEPTTN